MKKGLFLFLISIKLFAQQMPIAESNVFVYDKNNYGNDLLNSSVIYNDDKSGAIFCQPYTKEYIKVGNTTSIIPFTTKIKDYPYLYNEIQLNKLDCYCTTKCIFVVEKDKIKKTFLLNKNKEYALFFKKLNHSIYYLNAKYIDNPFVTLNKFDGNKIVALKTFFIKDLISSELVTHNNKLYFFITSKGKTEIYNIVDRTLKLEKTYTNKIDVGAILNFTDVTNFTFVNNQKVISVKNGIFKITSINYNGFIFSGNLFSNSINNQKYIYKFQNDSLIPIANSSVGDTYVSKLFSPETNSYYCGTNGDFIRLFPHIKKYPRLFYNSNSNSVFTLQQDDKNQIWAGSYQGALTIITNDNKVIQSKNTVVKFLNGGTNYKDKMLLIGESNKGILLYDNSNKFRTITDNVAGYFTYVSKNKKLYFGTSQQGLWFTDCENLDSNANIKWHKITDKQGLNFENILTISEDKFGNIWCGGKGICVYNPKTNKLFPFSYKENFNLEFLRTRTSILDTHNTLWFGTNKGELVFYNGKNATDYNLKNFIKIKHPLLENGKTITFIHQWNDYLILGASDKILLLDLKKWYANKTISVRYLNSMEINLSSGTEQNTVLTDKRDQSIWFATSDMVYQWNIEKWLTLPMFKVNPTILIKKDSTEFEVSNTKTIEFKPTENSFDIAINYQTKDNMPRFVNGILVKKGEKPIFESPNLQTQFQFKNLSAGDYVFYVRICQQDGSFDVLQYSICVDSFLWQKWWFWVLLSIPFFGIIIYVFQKRNEIEKQKKKLSQLNLSSLSNQFRPHFMLNALNSIGSQMDDKPHAEKVISRLGESIDILYNFTQKNKFTLPFDNEWKLVENSIEIQQLLFIPELNFSVNNIRIIPIDYKIPVGLLQIPIENALLHGLRNKTDGNCNLEINFSFDENHYFISIKDNGVGRDKAAKINNFKKNGNGLKTIFEMIQIINQHEKKAITFEINDLKEPTGTMVKISLNKIIDYDKIKL
jgi:hypothetical protein